jgi:hypothetical protein
VNRRVEVTEDQREIRRKKRVIEYAEKNERALDLAIEFGDMGTAKAKLRALRDEREGIAREIASVRIDLPPVEDLMPAVREKLRDLETTLKADIAMSRLALGGLLGDQRLKIYRDGRSEGVATLSPETLHAPGRTLRRADSVVAGACYARDSTLPVPLVLPVEGRVAAAAAAG